jgi:hypothetical protein
MIRLLVIAIAALLTLTAAEQENTYLPAVKDAGTLNPTATSESNPEGTGTPATPINTGSATPTVTPTGTGSTGGTNTPTPTSTPTATVVPSPYNTQAQAIVLQPEDMPAGFQLDSSEPMTLSNEAVALGAVTAHQTQYSNSAPNPTGPTRVESATIVFRTTQGASQAFAAEINYVEQVSGYERISEVTPFGDATAAFSATGTLNGQSVDIFKLFCYKGNVWLGVLISGPPAVTDLADAEPFIQTMLDKLE